VAQPCNKTSNKAGNKIFADFIMNLS